jgi:hypothetical protein
LPIVPGAPSGQIREVIEIDLTLNAFQLRPAMHATGAPSAGLRRAAAMAWNSERCHNGISDRFYDDAFLGLDVAKEDLEMIAHDVIRNRITKVGIHLRRSFNVGEKKRRPLNAQAQAKPQAPEPDSTASRISPSRAILCRRPGTTSTIYRETADMLACDRFTQRKTVCSP